MTAGIRITDGRDFTRQDDAGAPLVVMVNKAFARRYLDGAAFDRAAPEVLIGAVWVGDRHWHCDLTRAPVCNRIGASHPGFTRRGDDADIPVEGTYGHFDADLVVAFRGAAMGALLPQLVPEELISNAITWNTSRWQTAATLGPALGGGLIALTHNYPLVYTLDAMGGLAFCCFIWLTRPRPMR